jgi:hypothetical protein
VHLSSLCLLFLAAPLLQASETTGIKMTIRHVFAGNPSEQTIYVQATERGWNSGTTWVGQKQMAHSNGYPGHASLPLRGAT